MLLQQCTCTVCYCLTFFAFTIFILPFSATLVTERESVMQSLPYAAPCRVVRVVWPVRQDQKKGELRGQGEL